MCAECEDWKSGRTQLIPDGELQRREWEILKRLGIPLVAVLVVASVAIFLNQGFGLAGAGLLALGAAIQAVLAAEGPKQRPVVPRSGGHRKLTRDDAALIGWVIVIFGALASCANFFQVTNITTVINLGGTENLLSGFLGAGISSLVAVAIVIASIRAQRSDLTDELLAQRDEQSQIRRREAASQVLAVCFEFNEARQLDEAAIEEAHRRFLLATVQWGLDASQNDEIVDELMKWGDSLAIGANAIVRTRGGLPQLGRAQSKAVEDELSKLEGLYRDVCGFLLASIRDYFRQQNDQRQVVALLRAQRMQLPTPFGPQL